MKKCFIDQYGQVYYACTLKELKSKYYLRGAIRKNYIDIKNNTYHVGWSIGQLWFSCYLPLFKKVK